MARAVPCPAANRGLLWRDALAWADAASGCEAMLRLCLQAGQHYHLHDDAVAYGATLGMPAGTVKPGVGAARLAA